MFKYYVWAILILISSLSFATESVNPSNNQGKLLNRIKINLGEQFFTQIETDPAYSEMVQRIYDEKINPQNVVDALTEYKKSLEDNSRFDAYRAGNKNALTPEEIHGYQLFNSYGCAVCHSGENFGGTQFKQLGAARNFMIERKTLLTPADLGLAEVTKKTKDFYVFRVPSLRNVAMTYPYYHDGSVKSLDEAVSLMGKYQLGVEIPDKDIKDIVEFLKTLTSKSFEQQNSK